MNKQLSELIEYIETKITSCEYSSFITFAEIELKSYNNILAKAKSLQEEEPIMYTQEEILEGNKLIAEFMGAEVSQAYSKTKEQDGLMFYYSKDSSPDTYRNLSSAAIKYHSSWDWLMPLVEKIEELNVTESFFIIEDKTCILWLTDTKDICQRSSSKIESVYNTVVEFIKWHKTLTK